MSKRAAVTEKATPHMHAYGSWQRGGLLYGRLDTRHYFRECECGAKQVRYVVEE